MNAPRSPAGTTSALSPNVVWLLDQLARMQLPGQALVFGSVAMGTISRTSDLDVVIDMRPEDTLRLEHMAALEPLLQLARVRYGYFDPFIRFKQVLMVRSDDAYSWVRARNSTALLEAIERDSVPLDAVVTRLASQLPTEDVTQEPSAKNQYHYPRPS